MKVDIIEKVVGREGSIFVRRKGYSLVQVTLPGSPPLAPCEIAGYSVNEPSSDASGERTCTIDIPVGTVLRYECEDGEPFDKALEEDGKFYDVEYVFLATFKDGSSFEAVDTSAVALRKRLEKFDGDSPASIVVSSSVEDYMRRIDEEKKIYGEW